MGEIEELLRELAQAFDEEDTKARAKAARHVARLRQGSVAEAYRLARDRG
ncbi:MAG: hypothetical protein AB1Z98_28985 [Nannocystaceae bacterium]